MAIQNYALNVKRKLSSQNQRALIFKEPLNRITIGVWLRIIIALIVEKR